MTLFSKKGLCTKCGTKNSPDAKFCGGCGQLLQTTKADDIRCPKCQKPVKASASFCGECGSKIDARAVIQSNVESEYGAPLTWNRSEGEFAKRIDLTKGNLTLGSSLIVEPGSCAVILVDGAVEGVIDSGKYEMAKVETATEGPNNEGVLKKISGLFKKQEEIRAPHPPTVTALLMDSSDTMLQLFSRPVFTSDSLKVEVLSKINIILNEPIQFVSGVMKGMDVYTVDDVNHYFQSIYTEIMAGIVGQYSFEELTGNASKQKAFRDSVVFELQSIVKRQGYRITSIVSSSFMQQGMSEVYEAKSDILVDQAHQELELEKAVLDAKNVRDVEQLKLDDLKLRQPVLEEMMKAENLKEMTEITSSEELEAFKLKVDKDKVLRQVDWDSFMNELNEKESDRQETRDHALHILRRQRDQEKAILDIQLKHEYRTTAQQVDYEYQSQDLDNQHNLTRKAQDQTHEVNLTGKQQDIQTTKLDIEKDQIERDAADKNLDRDITNETKVKDHERVQQYEDAKTADQIQEFTHARKYREKIEEQDIKDRESEREREEDDADFQKFMEMQRLKNQRQADERKDDLTKHGMDVDVQKTGIAANRDIEVSRAELEIKQRLDNTGELKAFQEREREVLKQRGDELKDVLQQNKKESDERSDKFLDKFSDLTEKAIGGLTGQNQAKEEQYKQREEEIRRQSAEKVDLLNEQVGRQQHLSSEAMDSVARATGAQPRAGSNQPICPKCNIHQHARFCEKCGTKIY